MNIPIPLALDADHADASRLTFEVRDDADATVAYAVAVLALDTLGQGRAVLLLPDTFTQGFARGIYTSLDSTVTRTEWGSIKAPGPAVDAQRRVLLQPAQPGVTIPTVTTLTNAPTVPTAQDIATAVWGFTGARVVTLATATVDAIKSGLATQADVQGIVVDNTPVLTAVAGVKSDTVSTLGILEAVNDGGPVLVIPALPPAFEGYLLVYASFDDFGTARNGIEVTAKIQGAAPFSFDGFNFQRDGKTSGTSGQALTYVNDEGETITLAPATPRVAWLMLPPSAAITDRNGNTDLVFRFDSTGAVINRVEAIDARFIKITSGGSLWAKLQPPVNVP